MRSPPLGDGSDAVFVIATSAFVGAGGVGGFGVALGTQPLPGNRNWWVSKFDLNDAPMTWPLLWPTLTASTAALGARIVPPKAEPVLSLTDVAAAKFQIVCLTRCSTGASSA